MQAASLALLTFCHLAIWQSSSSEVAKVTCSSCIANDISGCDAGSCVGDYCIDYWSSTNGDSSFVRGCRTVLAGRNYFDILTKGAENSSVSRQVGPTFESYSGCNSGDFCNNGSIAIDSRQGSRYCLCDGSGRSPPRICRGDACIASGVKGSINYRSRIFYAFPAYPRYGSGCSKDGPTETCLCDTDFCNVNGTTAPFDPGREAVTCYDSNSKSGTCRGMGCGYIHTSNGTVDNPPIQFCHYESEANQFDRFCDMYEMAGTKYTRCYCGDDYCNYNEQTAVRSIENKTQCYMCEDTKAPLGCSSSSFCLGDVCVDEYRTSGVKKSLQRGCYEYLAGGPTDPTDVLNDCSLTETEDDSASFCSCSNTNYCMREAPVVANSSKGLSCFDSAGARSNFIGSCDGDVCLYGNMTGCVTYAHQYNKLRPFIPVQGSIQCMSYGNSKVCTCDSPQCNNFENKNVGTIYSDVTVSCWDGTSTNCTGSGCYYKDESGAVTRGCISEYHEDPKNRAPLTTDFACARKTMLNSVITECVCPRDFCNLNLTTAIEAVNEGPIPTTTQPPTTTTQPTTVTPTRAPTTASEAPITTSATPTSSSEAATSPLASTASETVSTMSSEGTSEPSSTASIMSTVVTTSGSASTGSTSSEPVSPTTEPVSSTQTTSPTSESTETTVTQTETMPTALSTLTTAQTSPTTSSPTESTGTPASTISASTTPQTSPETSATTESESSTMSTESQATETSTSTMSLPTSETPEPTSTETPGTTISSTVAMSSTPTMTSQSPETTESRQPSPPVTSESTETGSSTTSVLTTSGTPEPTSETPEITSTSELPETTLSTQSSSLPTTESTETASSTAPSSPTSETPEPMSTETSEATATSESSETPPQTTASTVETSSISMMTSESPQTSLSTESAAPITTSETTPPPSSSHTPEATTREPPETTPSSAGTESTVGTTPSLATSSVNPIESTTSTYVTSSTFASTITSTGPVLTTEMTTQASTTPKTMTTTTTTESSTTTAGQTPTSGNTTTGPTTTFPPYFEKRKCYYCDASDISDCVIDKYCEGYYCIDRVEPGLKARGCYDHLAGKTPNNFGGDECAGNSMGPFGYLSICGCRDEDYCRNGTIREFDWNSGIQCYETGGGSCKGTQCLYTKDSVPQLQGCLKSSPDFQFYSYLFPVSGVDGCVTVEGVSTFCTCSTEDCNKQTEILADRLTAGAVTCTSSDSKTGSCTGDACYLSINGTTPRTGCITGVTGGVTTDKLFCTSLSTPGRENTTVCLCNTDYCNDSLDKAISSIESQLTTTTTATTTTTTEDPWTPKCGGTGLFVSLSSVVLVTVLGFFL